MLPLIDEGCFCFFELLNLFGRQRWVFGGDAVKGAPAGEPVHLRPRAQVEFEEQEVSQTHALAGSGEGRKNQGLGRMDQDLDFFGRIGNAGHGFVGFHPDHQGPAVGIGHPHQQAGDLTSQLLAALVLPSAFFVFVGAEKFEKLSPLFPEQESQLVCLHDNK